MKKFIVFAVVLALLVPAAAFAATEFSLGGYIKLDSMWDSDNGVGRYINAAPARTNDANAKHGKLRFTAQGSRFSFTIKGPKLWGADVSGFLEMDFDANTERPLMGTGFTASNSYVPRLRHAMFRFNWPTSELLFGQYWSMFCEYYIESAEDGPFQMTGTPTHRLAQIRFTQKFAGDWTVAALIGDPSQALLNNSAAINNAATTGPYNANATNGQSAETPQVQLKVNYAHDFWGKAAYYGKPIPFTAQVVAGWQRNVLREGNFPAAAGFGTLGNQRLAPAANPVSDVGMQAASINTRNQYVNPWLVMGSLFIPVIPTQSANLAGTASILTQWWIGQGIEVFGFTGVASNLYKFTSNQNNLATSQVYEAKLLQKYGGMVEGQYYFNNQWFLNAAYGVTKAYGVNRSRFNFGSAAASGLNGMEWAMGDNAQTIQQADITLWYRPIQAIKFGLQYSYAAAHYFAYANQTASNTNLPVGNVANNAVNRSNFGDAHRVEFVGFFFF